MSFLAKRRGEVTHNDITPLYKWSLIILVSLGGSIMYIPMYLKYVFYDSLIGAFGCTNADLGLMLTMYGIASLILYLPSGVLADRIHMRTLSTIGFMSTAALTAYYATMPPVKMLYIIFLGYGLTTIGLWWPTKYKVVRLCCSSEEYPQKIGISYTIYGATGLVIGFINAAIIAACANAFAGIQAVLWFLAAMLFLMGILSIIMIPDFKGEIDKTVKGFDIKGTIEAIKWPGAMWASLAFFFVYALYIAATYTTPYMTQVYGADEGMVSVLSSIRTYGIAIIAGPIFGWLASKFKSASKSLIICLLATGGTAIGFLLAPDTASIILIAALVLAFGFFTYGGLSIGSSPLGEIKMPVRIFGSGTAIISLVGFLPDSFIHIAFGSLMDAYGVEAYQIIFGIDITFAVLGVFCLLMLMRSMKKNSSRLADLE